MQLPSEHGSVIYVDELEHTLVDHIGLQNKFFKETNKFEAVIKADQEFSHGDKTVLWCVCDIICNMDSFLQKKPTLLISKRIDITNPYKAELFLIKIHLNYRKFGS